MWPAGHGLALRVEQVGTGGGILAQAHLVGAALKRVRHHGREREAVFGDADGGGSEIRPRQQAVLVVRVLQHRHQQRCADGEAAHLGVEEVERFAGGVEEHAGRRARGRTLAAVEAGDGLAGRIVEKHEGAAADAGRLRLHQTQHEFRGDRRIHRVAAPAHDFQRGVRGAGIGGCGHGFARWRRGRGCRGDAAEEGSDDGERAQMAGSA